MKQLFFMISAVLFAVSACFAQDEQITENDSAAVIRTIEENSVPVVICNSGKEKNLSPSTIIKTPSISVLNSGKMLMKHEFSSGVLIGKDDNLNGYDEKMFSEKAQDEVEDKTKLEANFGLNFAYRLKFMPGHMADNEFVVNAAGFAYSFGIDIAGDFQKNYGFTCDILLATGIEFGTEKIGFGIDALAGTGNISGNIISCFAGDSVDVSIEKETEIALKYGAQVWLRASFFSGLFGKNASQNASSGDIRLFVRYIRNKIFSDNDVINEHYFTVSSFPMESLQVGICYSF